MRGNLMTRPGGGFTTLKFSGISKQIDANGQITLSAVEIRDSHNHDNLYSKLAHLHDDRYSLLNHNADWQESMEYDGIKVHTHISSEHNNETNIAYNVYRSSTFKQNGILYINYRIAEEGVTHTTDEQIRCYRFWNGMRGPGTDVGYLVTQSPLTTNKYVYWAT